MSIETVDEPRIPRCAKCCLSVCPPGFRNADDWVVSVECKEESPKDVVRVAAELIRVHVMLIDQRAYLLEPQGNLVRCARSALARTEDDPLHAWGYSNQIFVDPSTEDLARYQQGSRVKAAR